MTLYDILKETGNIALLPDFEKKMKNPDSIYKVLEPQQVEAVRRELRSFKGIS